MTSRGSDGNEDRSDQNRRKRDRPSTSSLRQSPASGRSRQGTPEEGSRRMGQTGEVGVEGQVATTVHHAADTAQLRTLASRQLPSRQLPTLEPHPGLGPLVPVALFANPGPEISQPPPLHVPPAPAAMPDLPVRREPLPQLRCYQNDLMHFPSEPRKHPHWVLLERCGWSEPEEWEYWRSNAAQGQGRTPMDQVPAMTTFVGRRQKAATQVQDWPLPKPYEEYVDFRSRQMREHGNTDEHKLQAQHLWREVYDYRLSAGSEIDERHDRKREVKRQRRDMEEAAKNAEPGGMGGPFGPGGGPKGPPPPPPPPPPPAPYGYASAR